MHSTRHALAGTGGTEVEIGYVTGARVHGRLRTLTPPTTLTDVEGNFEYFCNYARMSRVLDIVEVPSGVPRFVLRADKYFVFGGDACDNGPGDIRVVQVHRPLRTLAAGDPKLITRRLPTGICRRW